MIPALESIPESDFIIFLKLMIPIQIQIPAKIDILLNWNVFRVLELIPKSDIYPGYDSDSSKKRNSNTSTS